MVQINPGKLEKVNEENIPVLSDRDLSEFQSEREKLAAYRLALVDSTSDLLTLMVMGRDEKLIKIAHSLTEGALLSGSIFLLSSFVLGFAVPLSLLSVCMLGGSVIYSIGNKNE